MTRELDFRYNAPVIVPGGIPVDLDAAARASTRPPWARREPAAPGTWSRFSPPPAPPLHARPSGITASSRVEDTSAELARLVGPAAPVRISDLTFVVNWNYCLLNATGGHGRTPMIRPFLSPSFPLPRSLAILPARFGLRQAVAPVRPRFGRSSRRTGSRPGHHHRHP